MSVDFDKGYSEFASRFIERVENDPFRLQRDELMKRQIVRCEESLDDIGLVNFSGEHFSVSEVTGLHGLERDDIIFPKINHGFWEQLYTLFREGIEPRRMRVIEREPHSTRYLDSGMLDGLFTLVGLLAEPSGNSVSFGHVKFGFSLNNGDADHVSCLRDFETSKPRLRKVYTGAAIGAAAFFSSMFGERRIHLADGCFGKKGLREGYLKAFLERRLSSVDKIVFVVPPHLKGICVPFGDTPVEEVLVSGQYVHEEWKETVIASARLILEQLDRDQNVLVFCQAGVVSGLLGLYLALARRSLGEKRGRLDYLDLGQVLDVANPDQGGPWVKLEGNDGFGLFGIGR